MSGKPVMDDTSVSASALADANRSQADYDRGAFNPRGRLGAMGLAGRGGALVGLIFVALMAFALSNHSAPKKKTAGGDDMALDDKGAETSARQAAASLIAEPKPADLKVVAHDPFGNPIMDAASSGPVVPPLGSGQTPEQNATMQRIQHERDLRLAALAREQARRDAMRRAPIMVVTDNAEARGPAGASGQRMPAAYERGAGMDTSGASDGGGRSGSAPPQTNELEARLSASKIPTVRASTLANRNFLITAGNQLPCVLQTAMDSSQPGLTSCVIPSNVYSDNGKVILMEKGTRVLGEYQGGLSTGEHRIFVVWNRAITPNGVSVELGSPAADELGRAGMGGKLSTFFWERFGGALLLSIVGDAGNALSGSVTSAQMTANAPNQAAAIAAQDSQRIRPRLRAPQGSEMTIFVARDVDFSSIYSLHLRP